VTVVTVFSPGSGGRRASGVSSAASQAAKCAWPRNGKSTTTSRNAFRAPETWASDGRSGIAG